MIPHKTPRGAKALEKLRVFEGIPPMFEQKKRMVIPNALRVIRLKTHRNYCRLGDMSSRVGWKHDLLLKRLEDKRRVRSEAYFQKKLAKTAALTKAKETALKELSKEDQEILVQAGQA